MKYIFTNTSLFIDIVMDTATLCWNIDNIGNQYLNISALQINIQMFYYLYNWRTFLSAVVHFFTLENALHQKQLLASYFVHMPGPIPHTVI